MTYVLGIDLGTTNSCVAVFDAGQPLILENSEGGRTTPSVVAITEEQERLVGQVARRQAITNPENTVYSVKRLMGRRFDDDEVQRVRAMSPYRIVSGLGHNALVNLGGTEYAPPQVSSMILAKIRTDAEARLGEDVTSAVITVPAYFDDAQRQATKDAGRIAGLEVLRIINEPTAAALAYGFGRDHDETVAVYDLGGGTFDISILQLGDGVFEVKSTNGDTHLGGDDFDACIIEWLAQGFYAEHGIDVRQDAASLQRLKEAAEKAKIELSTTMQTRINLPFIAAGPRGPLHLAVTMTRSLLEGLVADLIEATIEPCRRALTDAELTADGIDAVILVGGQTRMPAVQSLVRGLFGREPSKEVNPDEVVAIGAAVQGAALTGGVDNMLLLDVTPLTLGVETRGGVVAPLIPRNTTIPTTCSETFTTALDGQDSVEVHVTQGERPIADENRSLARFHLDGIPAAPRGAPQIEVSFTLDANGILSVSARDRATGRAQQVTVSASSGLNEDDVARMTHDATAYQEEDRERQEKIALVNQADALLYQASRALRDGAADEGEDEDWRDELRFLSSALTLALPTGDLPQIHERCKAVRQALDAVRTRELARAAVRGRSDLARAADADAEPTSVGVPAALTDRDAAAPSPLEWPMASGE